MDNSPKYKKYWKKTKAKGNDKLKFIKIKFAH